MSIFALWTLSTLSKRIGIVTPLAAFLGRYLPHIFNDSANGSATVRRMEGRKRLSFEVHSSHATPVDVMLEVQLNEGNTSLAPSSCRGAHHYCSLYICYLAGMRTGKNWATSAPALAPYPVSVSGTYPDHGSDSGSEYHFLATPAPAPTPVPGKMYRLWLGSASPTWHQSR